jgi:hypothetical protein
VGIVVTARADAVRARGHDPAASRARALRPGEIAWIAALPCAVAILAAVVVLGPPLGHALFGPGSETLWPRDASFVIGQPEPTKHARYALALLGPLLLAGAVLAGGRRGLRLHPWIAGALVAIGELLALAFLTLAVLGQRGVVLPVQPRLWPIFSIRTMVVALGLGVALALALLIAAHSARVVRWVARAARDTRARRVACLVLAGALAAAWLLTAVTTEGSVGDNGMMDWTMDDPFAILNGRTPLVDFHALYAQLLPYPIAAAMAVFGTTVLIYTIAMTAFSGIGLLAVYAVLRRVVGSPLLALGLYAPVLAVGFLKTVFEPPSVQLSNVAVFGMWPLRYTGAYLLAWLTARHLDGAAPRRAWVLFLAAGLGALDNLEFGLAALIATVAALACAQPPRSRRALARLAADVAIGALAATALLALLTLVRSGGLPDFGLLLEFPRIFGVLGLVAMPMPTLGFQLVLYATFAAAIAVAAVRVVQRREDRLLTGMLVWSGVFGLLAGSYYIGRSDTLKLVSMLSAWGFTLALVVVAIGGDLLARRRRLPGLAELAVLFGFGLAICSLVQLPAPGRELARLRQRYPAPTAEPTASRFVAAQTRPGERVAILIALGHRMAYDHDIVNVAPYSFIEEMVTRAQLRTLLDTVRREHVHKLFLPTSHMPPEHLRAFAHAGFAQHAVRDAYSEWTDTG